MKFSVTFPFFFAVTIGGDLQVSTMLYINRTYPAVIYTNGSEKWLRHGKLHREDGPAKTTPFREKVLGQFWGQKKWFFDGKLHREGGPAIEMANGTKKWYRDGHLHREYGPAV